MPTADRARVTREALLAAVSRVRLALAATAWLRAMLIAFGASSAAWVVVRLVVRREIPLTLGTTAVLSALAATTALVLRWRVGRFDLVRAALWIEERFPAGFALVTLVEQSVTAAHSAERLPDRNDQHVQQRLVHALSREHAPALTTRELQHALSAAALRAARGPALFALGVVLVTTALQKGRVWLATDLRSRIGGPGAEASDVPAAIGRWRVRIVPPAYTDRAPTDAGDASTVSALSGSALELQGRGAPPKVRMQSLVNSLYGNSALASTHRDAADLLVRSTPDGGGWTATTTTVAGPAELRVVRDSVARLLLVDGYVDSIPTVDLRLPLRDSVLRRATGALPLSAVLHDDIGLAFAAFELIISTGEGEQYTARTVRLGATRYNHARDATLRAALNLDSMQLHPGDIVHLRAIARDGHPAPSRESGTSETRSFRIAKASEYDSVAVEAAPPPEFDKSLLSQRMLLLLTEKLEARRPRIGRPVLMRESGSLARDQGRLRLAVGDIVFQRLGGESDAEHAHGADDATGAGGPPGKIDIGMLEEGDDSPVIAINRPLLEAYNAMWDAGRALEQGDTKGAIPHMRIAAAAIERSRAASRLYLRGKPPTIIVDVARVRLAGKDTGVSNTRTPRTIVPLASVRREARLLAAAETMQRSAMAGRDSIALLRIESLVDAPDFARALDALLAHLARGGNLTDDFVRARRTLDGIASETMGAWLRAGPP